MDLLKKIQLNPLRTMKTAGLVIVGVLILLFFLRVTGNGLRHVSFQKSIGDYSLIESTPPGISYGASDELIAPEFMAMNKAEGDVSLSKRNIMPPEPGFDTSTGNNAEDFEITEYHAYIEAADIKDTCSRIKILKERKDVIFESASEDEKRCYFRFKVEHIQAEEILGIINTFDPKDLDESTYTIKGQIDDFTGEEEILKAKLDSIDKTLTEAITAYDEITTLAKKAQDVESLATIIDSKVRLIERLSQQKIATSTQLERLSRSKAEQLDRLEYTYFNVNVTENTYVDSQDLKDSWKRSVRGFVRDSNGIVQDVTVNLVLLLLFAIQYVIYLFIALIIAKFCWKYGKRIWKHRN